MSTPPTADAISCRIGAYGALSTLVGILLSGPLAIIWLQKNHPQPPWQGAETFANNYHAAQALPYFAGFFLVGGYVVLMSSLHAMARAEQKAGATIALVFTAAFATLVFFNYLVQTTFVPHLARHYLPEHAPIIAAFSMVNPASLGWAIEMWAWGFLGVATWIVAPMFSGNRLERFTAVTLVANGVTSVASALWTALQPAWVMTTVGLVGYSTWNALVFVMSTLAFLSLSRRAQRLA